MTNQQQCEAFWQARRSVILSTVDAQGRIETSVTPFIRDELGNLYIFISELAQHTQNILQLIHNRQMNSVAQNETGSGYQLSGLLVADESQTEQLFARERVTLQLRPDEIKRESNQFADLLARFEQLFGDVIPLLSSLPDFHLIQLNPVSGGYVKGFGQAFTFQGCPCDGLKPVERK